MSSTRRRVAANEAARFTAVVVLPTPPFWFATAMMRFMAADLTPLTRAAFPLFPARGAVFSVPALGVHLT